MTDPAAPDETASGDAPRADDGAVSDADGSTATPHGHLRRTALAPLVERYGELTVEPADESTLRDAGLSAAKVDYVRNAARRSRTGTIPSRARARREVPRHGRLIARTRRGYSSRYSSS